MGFIKPTVMNGSVENSFPLHRWRSASRCGSMTHHNLTVPSNATQRGGMVGTQRDVDLVT